MINSTLPEDILIQVIYVLVVENHLSKNWLPFRLVSRLFNYELLKGFFVLRIGQVSRSSSGGRRGWDWNPSMRFHRLALSWTISGALSRPLSLEKEHLRFLDQINGAVRLINQWIETQRSCSDEAANVLQRALTPALISSGAQLAADTNGPWPSISQVVSKALICSLPSCRFAPCSGPEPVQDLQVIAYTAREAFYLTACFLGIREAVADAGQSVTESRPAILETALIVAARKGHQDLVEYLLSIGAELKVANGKSVETVVSAAAESGNIDLIKMLLGPEHGLKTSDWWYGDALECAADFPDPATRLDMVKILWDKVKEVEKPQARTEVLFQACKADDEKLAEFVLSDGPSNMYHDTHVPPSPHHPLIAAVTCRSLGVMRAILNAPFTDIPTKQNPKISSTSYELVQKKAFNKARYRNHLPIFMELIPHQKWLDKFDVMFKAAEMDNGLEAINDKVGPFDFNSPPAPAPEPAHESPKRHLDVALGVTLLETAVGLPRPSNVTWLLKQGVRTQKPIWMCSFRYDQRSITLQQMNALLESYGNPGLAIIPPTPKVVTALS